MQPSSIPNECTSEKDLHPLTRDLVLVPFHSTFCIRIFTSVGLTSSCSALIQLLFVNCWSVSPSDGKRLNVALCFLHRASDQLPVAGPGLSSLFYDKCSQLKPLRPLLRTYFVPSTSVPHTLVCTALFFRAVGWILHEVGPEESGHLHGNHFVIVMQQLSSFCSISPLLVLCLHSLMVAVSV